MNDPGTSNGEKNVAQNMLGGIKWLKWIVEYRFVFIVIVILSQNLIYVIYISLDLPGRIFMGSGTAILMLIFCALAVSRDKRSLRIGLAWGFFRLSPFGSQYCSNPCP